MVTPIGGLRSGLPSVDLITATLQLIRAGELKGLAPGFNSVRDFARLVGFNESTLRTAFLTEGRRPSTRTMARLDAAIRANVTNLGMRTERRNTVLDSGVSLDNPLARHYLMRPPGARSFRLIARTNDPSYGGFRSYTVADPDIDPSEAAALLAPGETVDGIVWDVSG